MDKVLALFRSHGTKLLGLLQGTVATIAGVTGIIPDAHLKYYLLASALLTFWRGWSNTAANNA